MPALTRLVASIFATSAIVLTVSVSMPASAQTADAKPKPNPYGSPLDTLMSTRLWTDVPPAQDFVTATRPDAKALDYSPLTGKDPQRPKPRDAAGIAALQADLESGGAANEARAKGLRDPASPAPVKAASGKAGTMRHARKAAAKKPSSATAAD